MLEPQEAKLKEVEVPLAKDYGVIGVGVMTNPVNGHALKVTTKVDSTNIALSLLRAPFAITSTYSPPRLLSLV